jgi:arylsulfatase
MDMKIRPFLDEKIVEKATDFIKRKAADDEPFFAYVSLSHLHPPEQPHPDFDQTEPTRLGAYADLLAEIDHRVGQVVDCVEEAGIADNTLIVFSSDNATDASLSAGYGVHGGSNGPWRGEFMSMPWEGSYRTLAMARWPGKISAGIVTDQMVSIHDWYATFAAVAGASDKVPTDRPMDSVDISPYLLGESKTSGRQSLLHFGPDGTVFASKWGNIKAIFRYTKGVDKPIEQPQLPIFYDLTSDPREEVDLIRAHEGGMGWMFAPVLEVVGEYEKSIAEYPNIPVGAADFDGYGAKAKKKEPELAHA